MFKKNKSASSFKATRISSDDIEKKVTLESLGYAFTSASKKSGWKWSTQDDQSDENAATEAQVILDAWHHAGERTQERLSIPADTWSHMGLKEQVDMINEALKGN